MANSRVPITEHYPIQLHYIKALFCQAQYRQCIQACRDLVKLAGDKLEDNPLQKTFVNFYLGLCHDEIARLMHHNSIAKLPAFNCAVQHYQDAIDALPTQQEVRFLCAPAKDIATLDSLFDDDDDETVSDFPLSPTMSGYDPRDMGISRASSPILSSPPVFRHEPVISSPVGSPATMTSDCDDLESHDSFSELMTPNRVKREYPRISLIGQPPKRLSRDVSRISLLESTPKGLPRDVSRMSLLDQGLTGIPRDFSKISLHDPAPVQRIKSPTHGLMRPIRLGSPAKPHFLPPTLPYSGTGNVKSMLPKLAKSSKTEPDLTEPRVDSRYTSPEPPLVSPAPRRESNTSFSDASTISQASPQTPVRHQFVGSPTSTSREDLLDKRAFFRITDHINDMRSQLERHIVLVRDAQDRLSQALEEKRASRLAPTTGTPLGAITGKRDVFNRSGASPPKPSIPQARSYWSFVPEDIKAIEKKRWIAAGRERGWKKERFQPRKYQELCEKALEEL